MEQNIIGLGFDLSAFNSEQQAIVKGLLEVYNLSKQIGETSIKPGSDGGFTELKQKSEALKQLAADQEKLIVLQQKSVQVEQQSTAATKANTVAIQQENKSLQENIQQRIRIQNSMASYLASQKEDLALLRAGTISRNEYNKRIIESNIKIEQYKNQLLVLNKEIKGQTLSQKQQLDSYASLNKQYLEAQRNAKNLAVAYGIESKEAKAAAATAAALDVQLKSIDKSVGQSQRNVGNYTSAFTGGLSKVWGAVRQLAYVLPGVGIAGIIGFATEPIYNYISALFDLSEAEKKYNSVKEEAAKNGAAELAHLTILKEKLTDFSVSQSERTKYLIEYNKIADDSNKIDQTQINNLEIINAQIQKEIGLIEKRAMAKAAETALNEQAEKVIAAQIQVDRYKEYSDGKAFQDLLKKNEEEAKLSNDQNKKNNADALANKNNYLKATATLNGDIIGGQKKYISAKKDLDKEQLKLDLLASRLAPLFGPDKDGPTKDPKVKKIKAVKDEYDKWYAEYIKRVLAGFRELDEQERLHYSNQNELNEAERERRETALNETLAASKRIQDEENAAIEAHKAIRISNFDDELARKEISQKQYDQKKAAEEKAALIATLEVSKIELEAEKSVAIIRNQNITLLQSRIDKISAEITSAKAKKPVGKVESKEKEFYAQIEKDAFAAYSFVNDLVKARYENEMNRLQLLIDKNNEYKNVQIANINASTVSAQEKAAQIQLLESQTAAKNEELQRKMKAEKRKELIYDRDTAAIEIAAQTAIAVMKVLAQGGLYSTGLAVATAAFGALQIAALFARPIPNYGEGTDNHPGGPMIVGEKLVNGRYQKELVTIPGEGSFITDRPMLLNAAAGAKVKPLTGDTLNETMYSAMMSYTVQAISDKTGRELREIKNATIDGNRSLLSALNKQKSPVTNIIVEAGWHAHISKSVAN
jgi:hypothetical protein